jgi:hypothetical protein
MLVPHSLKDRLPVTGRAGGATLGWMIDRQGAEGRGKKKRNGNIEQG